MSISVLAAVENPGNPSSQIYLREANVQEALTFNEIGPESEELALTSFLDTVQQDSKYTESALWTAQSRLFALYWYCINTMESTERRVRYDCDHCGKKHPYEYDLKDLAANVRSITGKSHRDISLNDETVRVFPLTGESMEQMEVNRLELIPETDENNKPIELDEAEAKNNRMVRAKIRLQMILLSIDFTQDTTEDKDERVNNKESKIAGLSVTEFKRLSNDVFRAQAEMNHGLLSEHDEEGYLNLSIGNASCKEGEGVTALRFRFRNEFSIPMV